MRSNKEKKNITIYELAIIFYSYLHVQVILYIEKVDIIMNKLAIYFYHLLVHYLIVDY